VRAEPELPPAERVSARRDGLVLLAILAAALAVYWRGLSGELVYDDRLLIGRNPLIADLANLPRLFASGYWDFLDLREAEHIGYWRPLTAIVQALIWPLAGSRPAPYHAGLPGDPPRRRGGGLRDRAAPERERVAGRRDGAVVRAAPGARRERGLDLGPQRSAVGCLALLSIERFLAWRARGSRGIPLQALLAFALALLAKELAAALVPLLFLLDLLRPRAADEPDVRLAAPPGWSRTCARPSRRCAFPGRRCAPMARSPRPSRCTWARACWCSRARGRASSASRPTSSSERCAWCCCASSSSAARSRS
jgi:hypothetical protein